jgi:hypothetical protein
MPRGERWTEEEVEALKRGACCVVVATDEKKICDTSFASSVLTTPFRRQELRRWPVEVDSPRLALRVGALQQARREQSTSHVGRRSCCAPLS